MPCTLHSYQRRAEPHAELKATKRYSLALHAAHARRTAHGARRTAALLVQSISLEAHLRRQPQVRDEIQAQCVRNRDARRVAVVRPVHV
eukprot:IDg2003t1